MSSENNLVKVEYHDNNTQIRKILFISSIIMLILTLLFMFTNLDIWIEELFYDATTGNFIYAEKEPFRFLYEQEGSILVSFAFVALVLIFAGKLNPKKKYLGRYGWFLFLCAVLGTGLIVNFIFKGYWGRPRPRESLPFGEDFRFFHLWEPAFWYIIQGSDPSVAKDLLGNSSFSAGHPTEAIAYIALFLVLLHPEVFARLTQDTPKKERILITILLGLFGVIFVIGAYLLFFMEYNDSNAMIFGIGLFTTIALIFNRLLITKENIEQKEKILKIAKYSALGISVIGGFLMALARAVQFGHWPSDSMWSFIFVYTTAFILYYYVFDFPSFEKEYMKKKADPSYQANPPRPIWIGLTFFLIFWLLIASIIWIIEYYLLPEAFFGEFIAAIVVLVISPVMLIIAKKNLDKYKNQLHN